MSAPARGPVRTWTLRRASLLSSVVAVASPLPGGAEPPPLTAPSLLVAGTIFGTPEVGNTLLLTASSFSGNPIPNVTRQWERDGVAISGATNTSYTLVSADEGATITCTETATNSEGSVSSTSNGLGPVTAAAGGGEPDALATPTVALVNDAGTTPTVIAVSSDDYVQGYRMEWEFAAGLAPAKDSDGSYTTPTQRGVAFIDGESWARLDLALGYTNPTGPFSFHLRILRDNESGETTVTDQLGSTFTCDASPWSNDLTDTVDVSVASWAAITGVNKSQSLDVTGKSAAVNANIGAICAARALPSTTGKRHFEVTIDSMWMGASPQGNIMAGVAGGAASFQTTTTAPGSSTFEGSACLVKTNSSNATIYRNGGSQAVALPGAAAPAVGDTIIVEFDTDAHTVSYYYKRAAGSPTLLATVTLTSNIPSVWYGMGAGYRFTATFGADAFTANFGADPFLMTPSTGYEGW